MIQHASSHNPLAWASQDTWVEDCSAVAVSRNSALGLAEDFNELGLARRILSIDSMHCNRLCATSFLKCLSRAPAFSCSDLCFGRGPLDLPLGMSRIPRVVLVIWARKFPFGVAKYIGSPAEPSVPGAP